VLRWPRYKKAQNFAAAAKKTAGMPHPPPPPLKNGGVPLYNPAGVLKGRSVSFLRRTACTVGA
jgi:hypothetical protein